MFSTDTLEQASGADAQAAQPVQYLIYTDHESCPQVHSRDVYEKTALLTRKALQEAQKLGYDHTEFIVSTVNEQPENVKATQTLLHAVESGVRKETLIQGLTDGTLMQATYRATTTATLDLEAMSGSPNNRLLLIGNGKSTGTEQIAQQAQALGVKVIGYNPETRQFLGGTIPNTAPVVTKVAKRNDDGR